MALFYKHTDFIPKWLYFTNIPISYLNGFILQTSRFQLRIVTKMRAAALILHGKCMTHKPYCRNVLLVHNLETNSMKMAYFFAAEFKQTEDERKN